MFTTKELQDIDCTHFNIVNAGCYAVTLQSKDTGHYWHIIHLQYPSFATCKIQHKHRQSIPFHDQGSAPTLGQAIADIKEHDYYHLHVRPLKKPTQAQIRKGGNTMKRKTRKLTVYKTTGTRYQRIPQIKIQDDWLKEAGFLIGDHIQIKCQKNRLIITKSNPNHV